MRDFTSCYNEHAIKVSETSCSGGGRNATSAGDPSVQRSVNCFYRSKLSTQRELLIRVTWSKSQLIGQGFSVGVEDFPCRQPPPHCNKLDGAAANSVLLRKKKGSRTFVAGDSVVELHWDISSAKYDAGPEPLQSFYVVVTVDAEIGLLLGDLSVPHVVDRLGDTRRAVAEFCLISRREQVPGDSLYSTKARFGDHGRDHEIMIQCRGDGRDTKNSELCVCVDKKKVVHVRRLRWNFRGNQTIFVDGLPVDMMWDVHDWWFSDTSGSAAFMFRTRSALESRLWLEEEAVQHKQQGGKPGGGGFSLLIHAFKS